jgi:hypothetical protein
MGRHEINKAGVSTSSPDSLIVETAVMANEPGKDELWIKKQIDEFN